MRGPIRGEGVTVRRPTVAVGEDGFRAVTWADEEVAGVLLCPGTTQSAGQAGEPDKVTAGLTAHFPKAYAASLRGCRVALADGTEWDVQGDPAAYADAMTPGPWDREVSLRRVEG